MTGGWRTWVIVLGMIVVASASYTLARYWQDRDSHYRRLAPVADCDLHAGPCRAVLADGEVELSISPRAIPLMTPLQIAVSVSGLDAAAVVVEIRGLNMDMGLNRVRLQHVDGVWRGETILPVCSQRRMEWEAAVRLDAGGSYELPFVFWTTRP